MSKVGLEITKHWISALNATMRLDVHSTWGYIDKKTGIANGMFGQLHRKEADITGTQNIILISQKIIPFKSKIIHESSNCFHGTRNVNVCIR